MADVKIIVVDSNGQQTETTVAPVTKVKAKATLTAKEIEALIKSKQQVK